MTTNLSDTAKQAIIGAIASRGPKKGMLKAKCPPMGTDAAVAWQALMMEANPYKTGMGHILLMPDGPRAIWNEVANWIDAQKASGVDFRGLDRDRVALEHLGVW